MKKEGNNYEKKLYVYVALHKNSMFAEARTLVRALKPYCVRASAFFHLFSNFCAKPQTEGKWSGR